MTVKETLKAAAQLLRQGWCCGAAARTADGVKTFPMSPDAVYFCTIGAIHRVSGGSDAGFAARSELSRYLGMHLTDWNDGHVKNGEQAAKTLEKAAEAIA